MKVLLSLLLLVGITPASTWLDKRPVNAPASAICKGDGGDDDEEEEEDKKVKSPRGPSRGEKLSLFV